MILDKNLILSDAQTPRTAATTHPSDNIIDTVKIGDAVDELYFVAYVESKCTCTTATTVEVQLVTSDNLNAGGDALDSPITLWTSGSVNVPTGTTGLPDKYCFGIVRLPKPEKVRRYIGAQIKIGANALTGGAFDIYLTDNPQTNI